MEEWISKGYMDTMPEDSTGCECDFVFVKRPDKVRVCVNSIQLNKYVTIDEALFDSPLEIIQKLSLNRDQNNYLSQVDIFYNSVVPGTGTIPIYQLEK